MGNGGIEVGDSGGQNGGIEKLEIYNRVYYLLKFFAN